MDLARYAPRMLLYACVGIGLTGRKGSRFILITKSIAEVSSELIIVAVSVGLEADSSCLLCATWCLTRPLPAVKKRVFICKKQYCLQFWAQHQQEWNVQGFLGEHWNLQIQPNHKASKWRKFSRRYCCGHIWWMDWTKEICCQIFMKIIKHLFLIFKY